MALCVTYDEMFDARKRKPPPVFLQGGGFIREMEQSCTILYFTVMFIEVGVSSPPSDLICNFTLPDSPRRERSTT